MSRLSTHAADVLLIVRKELRAYSCSPIAYIVAALFVGITQFLFFASASVLLEASVAGFMYIIPWLLVMVVPALTMGLIAAEHDSGTYELLATRPITDGALVLGKFLSVFVYLALVCALTLAPVALSLSLFGDLDSGVALASYLAALFLSSVFASVGLAISAVMGKQVSALLTSVAVSLVLVMVGYEFVTQLVPPPVAEFFERLSVLPHYMNVARGVLDVSDLWYFVSFTLGALALAHYRLLVLRLPTGHPVRGRVRVVTALVIATVAVSNVLGGAIPGRLDLTERGRYTLAEPTVRVLEGLPDVVALTLYASRALPPQYRAVERDTRDLLRDYVRYGNGNISFAVKDPSESDEAADEALRAGIAPIQFNTVGEGALAVQKGYLGITVTFAGETYPIPFVENTGNLEYELTSTLVRLTRSEKKSVRFVNGAGGLSGAARLGALSSALANEYDIGDLMLASTSPAITDVDVLIVGAPTRPFDSGETNALTRYLESGGAILALFSGVALDEQSLGASVLSPDVPSLFTRYGVTVEPDIVYDLQASEVVQLRADNGGTYLLAYPWWLRAAANPEHPSTREVRDLFMPWSSSLTLDYARASSSGFTLTPLVVTTPYAGVARDTFMLEPGVEPPVGEQRERILGVALERTVGTTSARSIVLGSARAFSDESFQSNENNLAAALSMVGYLAQEASLAGITSKAAPRSPLTLPTPTLWPVLMYGNIAFGVLVPALGGALVLLRRRKHSSLVYDPARTAPSV